MPILEGSQRPENPVAYVEESDVAVPSLSLRDFIGVIRRRKAIAINTFILVVALGVVLTLMTKPVFLANARIQVEGKNSVFTIASGDSDPLTSLFQPQNSPSVQTQVEILRSPEIVDKVYKETRISRGSVKLDVRRVEDTDIVELTGTSNSSDSAQRFIETMPKVYQDKTRQDIVGSVSGALTFARNSLKTESEKLDKTEKALENYKNQVGVVDNQGEKTDTISALSTASGQLGTAQSNAAGSKALYNQLVSTRQGLSGFRDIPVTTTNPQVQILKDELARLQGEKNKLLFLYKEGDDEVRKVTLQIEGLQKRLASTPATVTNTTREPNPALAELDAKIADALSNSRAAEANLGVLRERVSTLTKKLGSFNNIDTKLNSLMRAQTQGNEAVNTLSGVVRQLTLRNEALRNKNSVFIIQPGGPAVQIAPSLSRNMVMAILLGALLACAAALLQDSLDDHVRGEDEARRLTTVPVLGYFPQLPSHRQRPLLDLAQPDRVVLENFRALRTNVQFTLVSSPGRKLQVTSSLPSEGKSYVASNLAIALALDGRKVILVDADLHRPRVHEIFDIARQPGLTNILLGEVSVKEALADSHVPGLRILAAGALPPNPVELLNSPAMNEVFEQLQEEADIVLFDSPPVLAAADGQVLASKMDGVLYVMQLGRIPRSALQRAMELLQQANAHVIGTVFNKVDEKQHADTYGGYGNYYYGLEEGEGGSPSVAPSLTSVLGRTSPQDITPPAPNGNGIGSPSSNGASHNTTKTN